MVSKNTRNTEKQKALGEKKKVPSQTKKKVINSRALVKKKTSKTKREKTRVREISKWVIWGVTSIVAVIYLTFVYSYYLKPYFYRWNFGDTYNGNPVVHGIDISHHQGNINWAELAKAEHVGSGIHFVFMKATEGSDWIDSSFQQNFIKARENGFIRGAYHFFSNTSSAEKQADFFCNQVELVENDLPPVLDVETVGNYGKDSLCLEVKTWLQKVERYYGVKPIIYTSRKFKEQYLNDNFFDTYPFWIAHYYVDSLTYKGRWDFWQHTDMGRLPGIKGHVDLNVYNGDLNQLKSLTLDTIVRR